MSTIEYVYLDASTLSPSDVGQLYQRVTLDSGAVILEAIAESKIVTARINVDTVEDVQYYFDTTSGDYVEQSRTQRTEPLYTLDEVKANKLDELSKARDAEIFSSFQSSALGSPKTYNYDKEAAENFAKKATLLGINSNITSVDWYVIEDAAFVTHTREQFVQVVTDGATNEEAAKMKYFQLEAQVKAATTEEEVSAVVW